MSILTDDGTLIVLVWVESMLDIAAFEVVVRLLDHVALVHDLFLFIVPLEDIHVSIVL